MKPPWPRRPKKGGETRAEKPLSAALDNPYRPVFGRERRFEELVRGRAPGAEKPEKEP